MPNALRRFSSWQWTATKVTIISNAILLSQSELPVLGKNGHSVGEGNTQDKAVKCNLANTTI